MTTNVKVTPCSSPVAYVQRLVRILCERLPENYTAEQRAAECAGFGETVAREMSRVAPRVAHDGLCPPAVFL